MAKADRYLFTPRAAVRMRGFSFAQPIPAGVGSNPPSGAVAYFYFKQKPDTEVTLEFLTAQDSVIRRFSTRAKEASDSFKVETGMNRFVWNLRYPDAHRFKGMILWAGGTEGPVAVPGAYKVRLTAGGWSETRSFEVVPDPRVRATAEDFRRQFGLLLRIRDRVSAANDAVTQTRDIMAQLDGVVERVRGQASAKPIAPQADSLKAKLSAIEAEIYQVKNRSDQDPLNFPIKLNNKLSALAGVVASADAAPTDQSYRVFEDLSAQLQVQLDRLKAIVATGIPAFNKLVKDQDVPAVIVR